MLRTRPGLGLSPHCSSPSPRPSPYTSESETKTMNLRTRDQDRTRVLQHCLCDANFVAPYTPCEHTQSSHHLSKMSLDVLFPVVLQQYLANLLLNSTIFSYNMARIAKLMNFFSRMDFLMVKSVPILFRTQMFVFLSGP